MTQYMPKFQEKLSAKLAAFLGSHQESYHA